MCPFRNFPFLLDTSTISSVTSSPNTSRLSSLVLRTVVYYGCERLRLRVHFAYHQTTQRIHTNNNRSPLLCLRRVLYCAKGAFPRIHQGGSTTHASFLFAHETSGILKGCSLIWLIFSIHVPGLDCIRFARIMSAWYNDCVWLCMAVLRMVDGGGANSHTRHK